MKVSAGILLLARIRLLPAAAAASIWIGATKLEGKAKAAAGDDFEQVLQILQPGSNPAWPDAIGG